MTFFHLKLPICAYQTLSSLGENLSKTSYQFICKEFLCSLNKVSYEKKHLKFSKDKKKVMTFHDEMYCTMNFLSLLVATSKKHNLLSIRKIMFAVFPQLTSYKALL